MGRKVIRHDDIYKPIAQQTSIKTDEEKMKEAYINHDHTDTMENGSATFLYIITMMVGAIFIDRLLIWGMASFIYFRFINRRAIRQKKWDKMQEEKKNGGNKQ